GGDRLSGLAGFLGGGVVRVVDGVVVGDLVVGGRVAGSRAVGILAVCGHRSAAPSARAEAAAANASPRCGYPGNMSNDAAAGANSTASTPRRSARAKAHPAATA